MPADVSWHFIGKLQSNKAKLLVHGVPSLAVIDVSFISLRRVLPATVPHLATGGRIYALIKPQFEVGRERIGKGGIVRDAQARDDAVAAVLATAEDLGLDLLGTIESPITGTEGNIEYLAGWQSH